jgi:hypothetical protein
LNAEVIKLAKKAKIPAPGTYEFPKEKIRSIPKVTSAQLMMNDDC